MQAKIDLEVIRLLLGLWLIILSFLTVLSLNETQTYHRQCAAVTPHCFLIRACLQTFLTLSKKHRYKALTWLWFLCSREIITHQKYCVKSWPYWNEWQSIYVTGVSIHPQYVYRRGKKKKHSNIWKYSHVIDEAKDKGCRKHVHGWRSCWHPGKTIEPVLGPSKCSGLGGLDWCLFSWKPRY